MTLHSNNFNFLRLLFASFVVISHSYALTGLDEDFVFFLSDGQASLSTLGVHGFMTISGYLIFKSYLRSGSFINYLLKRLLRIVPALIVVIFITAFIVGPFFSILSFKDYFSNVDTYKYLIFNSTGLLRGGMSYVLPGVFLNNPYKVAVNGCLWTIPYEFFFYLLLGSFFLIRKDKRILFIILLSIFIFFFFSYILVSKEDLLTLKWPIPYTAFSIYFLLELGLFFVAGCLLTYINLKEKLYVPIFFGALLLFSVSILFSVFNIFQFAIFPIGIIAFANINTSKFSSLEKIGDLSYGVYLSGFVIQQMLASIFQINYILMILLSLPLSLCFGYLSWHFVEKKALALKDKSLFLKV